MLFNLCAQVSVEGSWFHHCESRLQTLKGCLDQPPAIIIDVPYAECFIQITMVSAAVEGCNVNVDYIAVLYLPVKKLRRFSKVSDKLIKLLLESLPEIWDTMTDYLRS